MKGIILAGGSGTRLYPLTKVVSKQALPIYDKPMIYYPLSTLMLAGIRDITIISTPRDIVLFSELLGDGSQLGLNFSYAIQSAPRGIAEAFLIASNNIMNSSVCLVLGDNVFHGVNFRDILSKAREIQDGAVIFGYQVADPTQYGVVEFNESGMVLSIEEKPQKPKSSWAVPGLYFYDKDVLDISRDIKPSARGELEITAVNNTYVERNKMQVVKLSRGMAWLDTGTISGMLEASEYVESIQKRQGLYISCIEEIAYRLSYIDLHQLRKLGKDLENSDYGRYLLHIAQAEEAKI